MAEITVTSQSVGTTFKEAVCIDCNRIYDTCRDQDCLEDLRVYFSEIDSELIDRAVDCRCKSCEVVWVYLDTEPVGFNKGCYLVKIRFYFKCVFDVYLGSKCPTEITGMATYEKKCVLYGSEGNTKTYSSEYTPGECQSPITTGGSSLIASIELVDPVILGCRIAERCTAVNCTADYEPGAIPPYVVSSIGCPLCTKVECEKRVLLSIGIFSIVKLERKVQLLIPAYDFCIPDKRAVDYIDDEPCDIFKKIEFPTDQFYPPAKTGDCL